MMRRQSSSSSTKIIKSSMVRFVGLFVLGFGAIGCNAWTTTTTTTTTTTKTTLFTHQLQPIHGSMSTSRTALLASTNNHNYREDDDDMILDRRRALQKTTTVAAAAALWLLPSPSLAIPTIDVNNAMAREFTAFPGLYPTIATKIVNAAKDEPFKSKKDVYAILNEVETDRLKQYDASLIISKPDKALQQFKTSQICKYECGGRTSSSFRDEQIKDVQRARSLDY